MLDYQLDIKSICTILLIILFGILFISLQKQKYIRIEKFPHYTEKIHQKPKTLIPKLTQEIKHQAFNYKTLPDDYDYLYDYEKNFDLNRVSGDYTSRLDAYENFLLKNRNSFHNLDDKDINNLIKLLNEEKLSNSDIPNNFIYKKDFTAMNH